jgi:hypothetical protein
MEPTNQLCDELFRRRVLRARQMSPEEKLLEGCRLFERLCRALKYSLREQYPCANEEQIATMLGREIDFIYRSDDPPDLYQPFFIVDCSHETGLINEPSKRPG